MPRCLVIGGRSFLGRHVVERLKHADYEVITTSRQATPVVDRVCDLLWPDSIDNLLADTRPDWILSFAGITRHDPDGATNLHMNGTRNLLDAVVRQSPQSRIVIMGSAAEYGRLAETCLPTDEDCSPGPVSDLGASKQSQTQLARHAAAQHRLAIISLRPFNIVGPGQPEQYLAGNLIRRLISMNAAGGRQALTVTNSNSTRDFVDVRDVADAVLRIVRSLPITAGQLRIFNVCTGQETAAREIAKYLCELAGGSELVDSDNQSLANGLDRSCGSYARLERAVGWRPSVSWQHSLRDAWQEAIIRTRSQNKVRPAA